MSAISNATEAMQAAQIIAPNQTQVTEIAKPEPAANEVLIEVKNSGICGTDIHILKGEYALAKFPMVPGHEFSGVVAAIGDKVTQFKVGDRVAADPNIPCNYCYNCQRNQQNQCQNLGVVGVNRDGGFAKYVTIPEGSVFNIGDISFAEAALIEPLACVVWGLKQVQIQAGSTMAIFGAGPMGCLMMQAVKRAGAASVTMIDIAPARLELAKQLGANEVYLAEEFSSMTTQYDVVADATGVPKVLEGAFKHVRPAGTVWVFGVAPDDAFMSVSPADIFRRDLKIIGSFALNKTFNESIEMVRGGGIQLLPLISHSLPLSEFQEGLHLAQYDDNRMKIQFEL